MPDESFAVRRKIGLERGYDGRQYAADALTHGSSLIEHLESSTQYPASRKETFLLLNFYFLLSKSPAATAVQLVVDSNGQFGGTINRIAFGTASYRTLENCAGSPS